MDDFEQELKVGFLDEALQSATEVETCFLELERDSNSDENINRIFRHVHNLKGSARAVGFEEFADFTHQFENFILKVKSKEIKPTSVVISILLKGNDQIIFMINELKTDMNARFEFRKVEREIQDILISSRMVSIKPTFQKMQRIVRDTSQSLNKNIQLEMIGEETEVDKTVLEKINDPLVHLIRNAVDHGVETIEKRIAAGKNPSGQIKLSAQNLAGKMVIEIKDDGGGMDPERLKKKAIEKGLIKANNTLTDEEALSLIFAPGFSTKDQVTDLSGRGVGMDVVRTNISDLRGEIIIESAVGKGSMFRIILPLTRAIVDLVHDNLISKLKKAV